MTPVWVLRTVAACVMILGGFAAMGYTESIPTGIIVLGCSWMVLTGLHKVGGWHELIARVSPAAHIAQP